MEACLGVSMALERLVVVVIVGWSGFCQATFLFREGEAVSGVGREH